MLTSPPVPGLTRYPAFLTLVADGAGPGDTPGAGEGP
jgi:hypothetical protein